MKIALDYDDTYTKDVDFWNEFLRLSREYGHEVRIVTARHNVKDKIFVPAEIIYCDGVAKRFVCHHHAEYDVDIWIDDKPQSVDNNGPLTRAQLEEWRASRAA